MIMSVYYIRLMEEGEKGNGESVEVSKHFRTSLNRWLRCAILIIGNKNWRRLVRYQPLRRP